MKKLGAPVIGWFCGWSLVSHCQRAKVSPALTMSQSLITYIDGNPANGTSATQAVLELIWHKPSEDCVETKRSLAVRQFVEAEPQTWGAVRWMQMNLIFHVW
jgi:hypothetical protein